MWIQSLKKQGENTRDEVLFTITITNLGTTDANDIVIYDSLPLGYQSITTSASLGVFNSASNEWTVPLLNPNQSETLSMTASVTSSNNLLNVAFLQSVRETDRDENNNEDSAEVTIGNCLKIPQGFSPTDDGLNDFFVIPCIQDYLNNRLKIYNRLGVQVYESRNYQNTWDGIPNMGFPKSTKRLPTGTYFYILEIDGFPEPFNGWVYLNY